jgi:hypothetical protein
MQILPNGKCQFIDQNGAPLVNGSVSFYAPGTTNPLPTYQDSAGTIQNTNPIQLDSRGQAIIWGSATYRQIVKDASGVTVWDQIVSAAASADALAALTTTLSGSTGASTIGYISAAVGSTVRTVQDKLRESYSVEDAGAVGDGSDETAKLVAAITYAATNGIPLYWPAGKKYGFTNIVVAVAGAVYHWIGTPRLKQLSTRVAATNALELDGVQSATLTLTATSLAQSNVINVSDGSQIVAGNTIRLLTNRLAYGDHRFDPNNCIGQLVKVGSVSGNAVTLKDPLVFDLPVAAIASGTAQGGTSGTIILAASDASTENTIKNYLLTITAGTGAGQSRYINTYDPTTKIADIGTSYTGFPQAAWVTIPDATSQYSISATCQALVMQTASARISGLELEGYPASGVAVRGMQVSFCDSPVIENCKISGFSNHALYTYHNYRPKVIGNTFTGANYVTPGGGGLGYGLFTLGNFGQIVANNTADNCHTGFDSNIVTGGGLTYDGNQFWPQNSTYVNSGISSHTGSFYITDIGNQICDVYNSMQKGFGQTFQGNTIRGRVYFPCEASYCTSVTYIGNTYEDGITYSPSNGLNGDVNGNDDLPLTSNYANRAQAFLGIRQATLVRNATIVAKGNVAKSVQQSFAYVTNPTPTGDAWSLTLTENDVTCIPLSQQIMGMLKHDGTAVPSIQNFIGYNNMVRVGGPTLGSIKSDNINLYPMLDALPLTSALTFQIGLSKWRCIIPQDGLAQIPLPAGQLVYRVNVFEKDAVVTNMFSGTLQRGNTTPLLQLGNTNAAIRTDTPAGTTGTVGNINIFNRTDSIFMNNRNTAAGTFIFEVEGIQS